MEYTVKQLADLAGITIRTLHYYDEIGLLNPSVVKSNGYRYYSGQELIRLQHILFFRELDFPLEDIKTMMNNPQFRIEDSLKDQKTLLLLKKDRLERLIQAIDTTITTMKGGDTMNNNNLFTAFDDDEMNQYKDEAKRRWGHTEAYIQSLERTKNWTKEDYKRIKEEGLAFTKQLGELVGKPIDSDEVQYMVEKHHKSISIFYDCPVEMYRCLGDMYVDDPRFTAYYDNVKPGLAIFLRDAIRVYCDKKDKRR